MTVRLEITGNKYADDSWHHYAQVNNAGGGDGAAIDTFQWLQKNALTHFTRSRQGGYCLPMPKLPAFLEFANNAGIEIIDRRD